MERDEKDPLRYQRKEARKMMLLAIIAVIGFFLLLFLLPMGFIAGNFD